MAVLVPRDKFLTERIVVTISVTRQPEQCGPQPLTALVHDLETGLLSERAPEPR